jgi:hypothetical protein
VFSDTLKTVGKQKQKSTFQKLKTWLWILGIVVAANFGYHIYRNPLHLLSFFSRPMNKTPRETWSSYADVFKSASTGRVSAPLLAAIAQVESHGNPLAAPEWRLQLSTDIMEIYAPASSAFGLMQITKGTFDLIMKTCGQSGERCPNSDLATRMKARDSVVLTAGFLQRSMEDLLSKSAVQKLSEEKLTKLASVIHLCGAEVGKRLIRNGYNVNALPRCGSHWPSVYASQVADMRNLFEIMSSRDQIVGGE